ncbi:metallophosphatase [candidate division SR1 bacterium]|nr:metallophosphatase [candidate division SR1 bacterium]
MISLIIAGVGVLMTSFNFSQKKFLHFFALLLMRVFPLLIITTITLAVEQAFHLNFWTSGIRLGVVIICFILLVLLVGFLQYRKLISTVIVVQSEKLKKNRKLIYISDLHVDGFHGKRFLKHLVNKIIDEEPELVLIGGDLVNTPHKSYISYFRTFQRLKMPVYAVIGNHDVYFGDDTSIIEKVCHAGNIKLLRNESMDLFDDIQLVGIDDCDLRETRKLKTVLASSQIKEENKFTILLSHRPYLLSKLSHTPIDLELAGHTHRGQIRLFTQLSQYFDDYVYGLAKRNGKTAFTSQGVGSNLPIRLGTEGEIVVLHLETK